MADANYTHLTLVVDRSGSMSGLAEDATGGINAIIEEQLAESGNFTFTLIDFDTEITEVVRLNNQKIDYRLRPRGGTALFDAIGVGYSKTVEDIEALKVEDQPETVIFMIVTDGHENSSREHSAESVKKMIEDGRSKGWNFQFLGAEEAALQAERIGANSTQFRRTGRSVRSTYRTMNEEIKTYRKLDEKHGFSLPDNIDDDFEEKYESDKDAM
jgi:hypothetical protein